MKTHMTATDARIESSDDERRAERELDRQLRRYNATWSECTFDELPDWAHRELDEGLN